MHIFSSIFFKLKEDGLKVLIDITSMLFPQECPVVLWIMGLHGDILASWFSTCGLQGSSSSSITWEFTRNAIPHAPSGVSFIRNSGGGTYKSVFWQVFQVILSVLKFKKHCHRSTECVRIHSSFLELSVNKKKMSGYQ